MQRWGIAAAAVLAVALGAGAAQAAPTWSVSDAVVSEGDAQVTFTITAANLGLFDSETVEYATVDGTATAPGDYTARHDTAPVFSAVGGTATATVNVPVSGDTTPEGDETFQLVLANPSAGTIADGTGQARITNDDAPHLRVSSPRVSEKDGAAMFTVSLDGAGAVSVRYATADGSAFAGSDYTAQSGTLSFGRADSAKTVSVPLVNDAALEGDEAFQLQLSDPSGAAASGNDLAGTATIADDDAVVPLPTSGSTTGPVTKDTTRPRVHLTRPRSTRGTIVVSVTCPRTEVLCRGTLTSFATARRRERRLGKATFAIAGGRTAVITTPIPRKTLRILGRAGKVRVRSYAVVRDAAGTVGTASAGVLLPRVR
jgi:hypothetical protein